MALRPGTEVLDAGPFVKDGDDAAARAFAEVLQGSTDYRRTQAEIRRGLYADAKVSRPLPLAEKLLKYHGEGFLSLPDDVRELCELDAALSANGKELNARRGDLAEAASRERRRLEDHLRKEALTGKPVAEWNAPAAPKAAPMTRDEIGMALRGIELAKADVEHRLKREVASYEVIYPLMMTSFQANVLTEPDPDTTSHAEYARFAAHAVTTATALHELNSMYARDEFGLQGDAKAVAKIREFGIESGGIVNLEDWQSAQAGLVLFRHVRIRPGDPEPTPIEDVRPTRKSKRAKHADGPRDRKTQAVPA